MEINDTWGEAKAQIGEAIDKNTSDVVSLRAKTNSIRQQMFEKDRVYQVGDILSSIGSAPSDNWLKCDGSAISAEDYPKLCEDFGLKVLPNISTVGNSTYYIKAK